MAGAYPVEASIADFGFSSCYKFLLGCTGVAIAYWNQRRQPDWCPATLGWYSVEFLPHLDYRKTPKIKLGAARFSRGNLSYPSVYVLDGALAYLGSVGEDELADHIKGLAARFYEGLTGLGVDPITPSEHHRRGPSICVQFSDAGEAKALVSRLAERAIVALNIDQYVRFSFHGYLGSCDVDRLIEVLGDELPGRQKRIAKGLSG
jgi:selenocysteine lyase/cysteine desulfurase